MSKYEDAIAELRDALGDQVTTGADAIRHHGTDEAYFDFTPPDAVVYPRSTSDVQSVVKICARHKCPIVAWGVGTSLEGHALAINGGISLDMSMMDQVIEIYPEDLCVRVGPGLTREGLNEALRATGLFFPIDPGANATLGGMAATRASGTTAVRYGTMRENVMALEVVMADGSVIQTGSRAKKSSAGYDLTKMFIGSEGTLGIITELTIKLHGVPEAIAAASSAFETVNDAVNCVISAVQMGIPVARMELLDIDSIEAVNAYADLNYPAKPHLFMEFHGSEIGVEDQSKSMAELVDDFGGEAFTWSTKTEDRNRIWKARHNAFYAIKGKRPGAGAVTTDICVPISQLAKAIDDTKADAIACGVDAHVLGHVGDGNYHCLFLIDPNSADELKTAKDLANRMAERAILLGGTVTGEHGIGMGKMKYMQAEHGHAVQTMIALKRALDPHSIMNPGKILAMN